MCKAGITYRENTFPKNDDVHVERFKVCRAVLVLLKTPKTDEIIRPEKFDLLAGFFHEDIFCRQWMYREHLPFANTSIPKSKAKCMADRARGCDRVVN